MAGMVFIVKQQVRTSHPLAFLRRCIGLGSSNAREYRCAAAAIEAFRPMA
jgi:hypothetical protein